MSKYARQKGHNFERWCSQQFREIGFTDCQTTRAARGGDWSKTDGGRDLVETGHYAVQCKNMKGYCSVNTIEEIKTSGINLEAVIGATYSGGRLRSKLGVPLVITKANNKEPMAILPWSALKELLRQESSAARSDYARKTKGYKIKDTFLG